MTGDPSAFRSRRCQAPVNGHTVQRREVDVPVAAELPAHVVHLVVPSQRRMLVFCRSCRDVEAEFPEYCRGRGRALARSAGRPAQPQVITDRVGQDQMRPKAFRNAVPFVRDEGE